MRLVPRQLRRADFPSSVPYYGGRLTPQVIAGLGHQAPPGRPPTAAGTPTTEALRSRRLAALADLRAGGVVTEQEYDAIRRRILGGR